MGIVQVGTDVHGDANLWTGLGGDGVLSSKVYDPFEESPAQPVTSPVSSQRLAISPITPIQPLVT
jgi:hypothetical protein